MASNTSTLATGTPRADPDSHDPSVIDRTDAESSPAASYDAVDFSPGNGKSTKECPDLLNDHRSSVTGPDLVTWDGPNDPQNPLNWSKGKKWNLVLAVGFMTFCVSLGSSIWSTVTTVTAVRFDASETVMTLGVSLYVLGFALGPLAWAPLSEIYGRMIPMFAGEVIFLLMQIPVALAENLPAIFICRFLAGAFGSATIAIPPAMAYDLFVPAERSAVIVIYTVMVFAGPCVGPIVGSFIMENSSLGWHWASWIVLILGFASLVLGILLSPETYEPVLLQRKAARLRLSTRNWSLHAKLEEHPITLQTLKSNYIIKPLDMAVREPILVIMTLYNSLAYALLYLTFLSFPYIFIRQRHWSPGVASLPFVAIFVGFIVSCLILGVYDKAFYQPRLLRRSHRDSGTRGGPLIHPEDRIPPMFLGSLILPAGLFWLGWTASAAWPAQVLAGLPIGVGIMLVHMSSIAYMIDVYQANSNSALAVTSLVRSVLAAGFPLFADNMYERLGVGWASSLLGFLFVALVPFPIVFWIHGERIRGWSRFSFVL